MKGGGWRVSAEQPPHFCLVEGSLTDWTLTLDLSVLWEMGIIITIIEGMIDNIHLTGLL